MSIELQPGNYEPSPRDEPYFTWLESHIREKQEFIVAEANYRLHNPVVHRILSEAAAELAPNDPRGHATYFGSLLLLAEEMRLETARMI